MRQLYGHLPDKPLLWTPANGGQWLTIHQCMFADAACLQQDTADVSNAAGQHALGPTNQQQQAPNLGQEGGSEAGATADSFGPLGTALITLGLPLAALPRSVLAMMLKYLVRNRAVISSILNGLNTLLHHDGP